MGFLCVGEPSERLIPHWCVLCELMESVVTISFIARSRKRRPGVSLAFGLVEPVRRGSTVGRGLLSCAIARAFVLSLLDRRPIVGCDGDSLSCSDAVAVCRLI